MSRAWHKQSRKCREGGGGSASRSDLLVSHAIEPPRFGMKAKRHGTAPLGVLHKAGNSARGARGMCS
eukprot:8409889-Alexandrium_andersonii.AAC.1